MLDTTTEQGARAAGRLAEEPIIWLTTVDLHGRPQTSPVWFLYDGDEFLVYSLRGTARTRNIETNPRVSLNLDGNGRGGDIVVIEGEARIETSAPPSSDVAEYQDKYAGFIERNGWTPQSFATDYPIPIRIRPRRFRVW
jgi:PPOX class probable F420-dependent enzyme